jgi:hypothetical protein
MQSCLSCYKKLIGGNDTQSLVLNNNGAGAGGGKQTVPFPQFLTASVPVRYFYFN